MLEVGSCGLLLPAERVAVLPEWKLASSKEHFLLLSCSMGGALPTFPVEVFLTNRHLRRMVSSGMLRRVALVRTDVSEEPGTSFIRVN
jgi:hypothetical protein